MPEPDPVDAFLRRWELDVGSATARGREYLRLATDFGRLAIQSAFLINGGALLILPPLMEWVGNQSGVYASSGWFVAGLVLAAMAALLGYVNHTCHSQYWFVQAHINAIRLNSVLKESDPETMKRLGDSERQAAGLLKWVDPTAWLAVLFGVLSYAAFIGGTLGILEIATAAKPS